MTKSRHKAPQRSFWTEVQIDALRRLYPDTRTVDLEGAIGRPARSIYAKANELGIKKSAEFLASNLAGRLDGVRGGATRFKPGITPWNKGTNFTAGGRSVETRFKPGHRGGKALLNYQPIGTERTSKDGYMERKINDGMPLQRRWRAVHLIEWEAINGPLPKGHALAFRDGNKQNRDLANLELVTRAELMRRNSYHTNYPKEIAQAIQLRGALIRKINNRSKKDEQRDNR